ncbi:class I SAM-dependent methyltransferase [Calothrix sp. 336/3]|uniref:class I SAM-dependent methyltransferase n=1 Tax=Calothrix sp. 336/3 TaxID=1337936 RepID=UPI0004E32939|nr:class I SAM-dependent methyltransferase [Calothrix sp. 336/3]AKG23700.1 type 11 methyltransferase [Calothrix sp. 336/3]
MQNPKSIKVPKATRYQNAAIDYYMGLTNSSFLHYGYWEELPAPGEELTISSLRLAQEAYSIKLMGFIPEGVTTVLDVGCGIGGNAKYLSEGLPLGDRHQEDGSAKRHFLVEGLAPDSLQETRFIENTQGKVPFYLSRFEDFPPTKSYDLILFSESSQYISADDLAQGASRLVTSGGYVLLADMMRLDGEYKEGIFSNCQVKAELKTALEKAGFQLIKSEDISQSVAPTIDLCINNFQTFGLTTGKYVADVLQIAVPPLHTLLNWAFKRWLEKPIVEGLAARKIFENHLCYEIQLWQLANK